MESKMYKSKLVLMIFMSCFFFNFTITANESGFKKDSRGTYYCPNCKKEVRVFEHVCES